MGKHAVGIGDQVADGRAVIKREGTIRIEVEPEYLILL